MKAEELIALGETLRQDFQALIERYTTDWLDSAYLTAEDLSEFRAVEVELDEVAAIEYKFAALAAWLTSGFVPANLAEDNDQWGEPAPEDNARPYLRSLRDFGHLEPTFIQPKENWPGPNQSPQTIPEKAAPRPPWGLDPSSPVKGLKDLAHFLESDQSEGGTITFEGVAPSPEAPGDFMALSRLSEMRPDWLTDFGLAGTFPDDQGAGYQKLSYREEPSAEYPSFARPLPEAKTGPEVTPPALRNNPAPRPRGTVNFSSSNFAGPELSSVANPDQNRRLNPPHVDSPGFIEEPGMGLSVETPAAIPQDISLGNHFTPANLAPDTFFKGQGYGGGPEFWVEEDAESSQKPGDVSKIDLELILEAIAWEIQQDYKRFYGS